MTGHQGKSGGKGNSYAKGEGPAVPETEGVNEDSCRCKEVSKKTLTEMLKLMLSDLAFWRKAKSRKVR